MPSRVTLRPADLQVAKLIHSWDRYPAKLSGKLARYIISQVSRPGQRVLDPFGGCGTVQVECCRLGRNSLGVDINPIAAILAAAKAEYYDLEKVRSLAQEIVSLAKLLRSDIEARSSWLDYWFTTATLAKLTSLRLAIASKLPRGGKYKKLLTAALAVSVRKCSRADPRSPKPFILVPHAK